MGTVKPYLYAETYLLIHLFGKWRLKRICCSFIINLPKQDFVVQNKKQQKVKESWEIALFYLPDKDLSVFAIGDFLALAELFFPNIWEILQPSIVHRRYCQYIMASGNIQCQYFVIRICIR
jgi:hypothetical protein